MHAKKRGVTSTGRAVENPNGGASFLASLRQPTSPPRLGPAQAWCMVRVLGGYYPGGKLLCGVRCRFAIASAIDTSGYMPMPWPAANQPVFFKRRW